MTLHNAEFGRESLKGSHASHKVDKVTASRGSPDDTVNEALVRFLYTILTTTEKEDAHE